MKYFEVGDRVKLNWECVVKKVVGASDGFDSIFVEMTETGEVYEIPGYAAVKISEEGEE